MGLLDKDPNLNSSIGFKDGVSSPVGATQDRPLSPSEDTVYREVHKRSDVDQDHNSIHHTLGWGPTQAAPGSDTDTRIKESESFGENIGITVTASASGSVFVALDPPVDEPYGLQLTNIGGNTAYFPAAQGKSSVGFTIVVRHFEGVSDTTGVIVCWRVFPNG